MFSSQNSQVSSAANYIEDVFSTYLYTGTGASQTITNGIDLAGKGGLVWVKGRTSAWEHKLTDTVRGVTKSLISNTVDPQLVDSNGLTSFSTTGFVLGSDTNYNWSGGGNYVSWTLREQPKFFDIVTYTGNGANRTISHNLGSVPGCIIVKSLDTGGRWSVYHRSLGNTKYLQLNATNAEDTATTFWNSTDPTSTVFSIGTSNLVNLTGDNYIAYLFAHDAGGFGLTGTDNVISCGSYVCDGAGNASINLGYEPQWLLLKSPDVIEDWYMTDVMRGFDSGSWKYLSPNTTAAEGSANNIRINATGFTASSAANRKYIYIAIRRGPMKTPTTGTSVFNPTATTATTGTVINAGFTVDAQIIQYRTPAGGNILWQDRLRGVNTTTTENNNPILTSNNDSAESNTFSSTRYWDNTGYQISANLTGQNRIYWNFRRAPGFFDEVCYTGTGVARTINHNLGVAPELIIVKSRSNSGTSWPVYSKSLTVNQYIVLNTSGSFGTFNLWNATAPTSSVFSVSTYVWVNEPAYTYVAYLFATLAGVSKVGSYTGTGALQTISCGFTAGARFVMIKRTDNSGDWYVWDSARGISSGNDPYLLINSSAAEVTGTNYVDTDPTGFKVTAAAPAELNASGGTYIFLAIA